MVLMFGSAVSTSGVTYAVASVFPVSSCGRSSTLAIRASEKYQQATFRLREVDPSFSLSFAKGVHCPPALRW